MGQRYVHYTERDNGTRVLYAHNQCLSQILMSEYLHLQNQNTVRHGEYKNVWAIAFIIFENDELKTKRQLKTVSLHQLYLHFPPYLPYQWRR